MLRKPITRKILYVILGVLLLALASLPMMAHAQGIPLVNVSGGKGGQQYSMSLQLLGLMTTLTLLPSMLLMMTSFVRIIIVLSILRQALGTAQTPPNTVLVGLALFLTASRIGQAGHNGQFVAVFCGIKLILDGQAVPGLYSVGEAAGFGGGGASGKRSLEGTFLPGCILTARAAARSIVTGA